MSRTQASLAVALQLEAVYLLHLGSLEVAYILDSIHNRLRLPACGKEAQPHKSQISLCMIRQAQGHGCAQPTAAWSGELCVL